MPKKEKILLLLNSAPEVKDTFVETYNTLTRNGYDVIVAVESNLLSYYLSLPQAPTYIFSDYFEQTSQDLSLAVPEKYRHLNLWNMYYSDFERLHFYDYKREGGFSERLLVCLVLFFDKIFSEHQIDYIVYENVSNSLAYTAYEVGKVHRVRYLGLIGSRLSGRVEFETELFGASRNYIRYLNEYRASGGACVTEEEKAYVDNYLANFMSSMPDYMMTNNLSVDISLAKHYANKDKARKILQQLKYEWAYFGKLKYAYQSVSPTYLSWRQFTRSLKRKIKNVVLPSLYDNVDLNEPYYLYPLHFHPESSTSIAAMPYVDELTSIRNIAFNLPFGTKLYVKDHPSAAGFPSLAFYKELKKIPNLKLVHHNHNTKFLIKHSLGVITLTSTVGFEALVMEKPVVVLGRVFYDNHPNCVRVKDLNDIFADITRMSATKEAISSEATVWAYYRLTFPRLNNFGEMILARLQELKGA